MNTVSIIIPMYNSERTIERCLLSVCGQSYKDLQIICVNDGSRDKSIEIVKRIAALDKRITVIDKKNGGVSSARNEGLRKATGKYIQFVDSDDCLETTMTVTLVKEIESSCCDIVICGYHTVDNKIKCSLENSVYSLKTLISGFSFVYESTYLNPPWNKLYRRDVIDFYFDETIPVGEDLLFNLAYLNKCTRIRLLENMLYIYSTGGGDSLTSRYYPNGFEYAEKVIREVKSFIDVIEKDSRLCDLFSLDFKRCFDNTVLLSGLSLREIRNIIIQKAERAFWRDNVLNHYNGRDKELRMIKSRKYDIAMLICLFGNIKKLMKHRIIKNAN